MMQDKDIPGVCYGTWYSEIDSVCKKCIARSRCRAAVLQKMKNNINTEDRSVNAFIYLVGLLDKNIGEYEVVRGEFSVLYRFLKNEKSVCVLIISKMTKRVRVVTKNIDKVIEEITNRKEADDIFNEIAGSI